MSKAIVLDNNYKSVSNIELPTEYADIHSHNLYLYVKSYLAAQRANTAYAKSKGEVSGGGKKPWAQKGRGGARAGSSRSAVWVGGGKSFGPKFRNYDLKINKKQKKLAFNFALFDKANEGRLFVVDSIKIDSGKTKDAFSMMSKLALRDALFVTKTYDDKTYLAFRNLKNCYLAEADEVNPYLLAAYGAVVIEKDVLESMIKGS